MSQMILYFSSVCPDTEPFINVLEQLNIEYESINITENIENLSRFIAIRDTKAVFSQKKQLNQVGIPVLVIDEQTFIFTPEDLKKYFI